MSVENPSNFELITLRPVDEILQNIEDISPKLVSVSVASNVEEEKTAFLNNEKLTPEFSYPKLESINYSEQQAKLFALWEELEANPGVYRKYLPAYNSKITRSLETYSLLGIANELNHETDEQKKEALKIEYMELNEKLYGALDQQTFLSLVEEKKQSLNKKILDDKAQTIRDELLNLLPNSTELTNRFKPSPKTFEFMQGAANELYGNLLSYVDEEKENYNPKEIADLFNKIINEQFSEAAAGWKTIVTKATSINVVASEKTIKIPENRKPVKPLDLKGLIVHEIGVHFLRSVMGEQTDFALLKIGLEGYYDAEEGLGMVMQQAVKGRYVDSGIPYYIVAGLMTNGADFREAHEVMWRIKLLEKSKPNVATTDKMIDESKDAAFKTVLRVARLTNGLPWYKDLSYFNGTMNQWKYLEDNLGSFDHFILMFYGKIDPSNVEHERLAHEARPRT